MPSCARVGAWSSRSVAIAPRAARARYRRCFPGSARWRPQIRASCPPPPCSTRSRCSSAARRPPWSGTSLGSCYAFLASVHDPRLEINVFNHCSTYFADVVWEGLSSQHIRQGLESAITLEQLRDSWMVISPPNYIDRYATLKKKTLFIYARYDTTFPVHFSEQVIEKARELRLDHKVVVLPCGHYTTGETPFKFIDGYHICSFLKRNL